MDFYTILDQIMALLRQRQRVTYQALQRQFGLDEAALNDLKAELLYRTRRYVKTRGGVSSGAAMRAPLPRSTHHQSAPRTVPLFPTPRPISLRKS